MTKIAGLLSTLLLLIVLTACSSDAQPRPGFANPPLPVASPGEVFATETTPSDDTPIPPIGTLTPIPDIASGGLGTTKDAWEKTHATAVNVGPTYEAAYEATYTDDIRVTFDSRGVIGHIAKDYTDTDKGMVSLDTAKAESLKLIPADAQLTYHFDHPTINPNGGDGIEPLVLVDVYRSESLSTLFSPDAWYGEEPGTFYIEYEQYASKDNKIGAFLMELSTPP